MVSFFEDNVDKQTTITDLSSYHGCFKAEVLNFYINNSWENLLNDQKFAARHDNIHKCNIYFVARYEKNCSVVYQSTVHAVISNEN